MKRSPSSAAPAAPALRIAPAHDEPAPAPAKPDDAALITALFAGRGSLKSIALRHGISLIEFAAWIATPGVAAALHRLCRLSDVHTSLIVSRGRGSVARSLAALAREKGGKETARKACLDLLNLRAPSIENALAQRGILAPNSSDAPLDLDNLAEAPPATPEEEASIHGLLQRLSKHVQEYEADEDAEARDAIRASLAEETVAAP